VSDDTLVTAIAAAAVFAPLAGAFLYLCGSRVGYGKGFADACETRRNIPHPSSIGFERLALKPGRSRLPAQRNAVDDAQMYIRDMGTMQLVEDMWRRSATPPQLDN